VDIYQGIGDPRSTGGGTYRLSVYADTAGVWVATLPSGLAATNIALIAVDSGRNASEMSPLNPR